MTTGRPPYLLALDVATHTGCCEGRVGERPVFSTKAFSRPGSMDEPEDVFLRALDWIDEKLEVSRPDWVFVEAPINPGAFIGDYNPEKGKVEMTTNPDTTIRLIGLWAVIAATVKLHQIQYRRVRVQAARKVFIGHGNLKGHEAKRRAFEMCGLLGWSPNNRDESDAACVWFAGALQVAPKLAPVVTPMLQHRAASTIGGVQIDDDTEALVAKKLGSFRTSYANRRGR